LYELTEKFDRHLSQAENVRTLFIALNDVVFSNRELAIKIIGRLALKNPAYVMPSLRKILIQSVSLPSVSPCPFVLITRVRG
jgi:FKBP12-rapamycin complex-associated protein